MIETKGMAHIGIMTSDAEALASWYVEENGFTVAGRFEAPDTTKVIFVTEPKGIMLELIQKPAGSMVAKRVAFEGGYVDHVAYDVDDVQAVIDKVNEMGLEIVEQASLPSFWENGYEYVTIRTPEGDKVEYGKIL